MLTDDRRLRRHQLERCGEGLGAGGATGGAPDARRGQAAQRSASAPLADLLLGALLRRREKIGDVIRDLAQNTDSPDDPALLLVNLALSMYAACYFGNWECD